MRLFFGFKRRPRTDPLYRPPTPDPSLPTPPKTPKSYRDLSANLRTYSATNDLPPELKTTMQEHLRLSFNNREASDEQVLSIYPSTIRRRILRHLYSRHLKAAYLFAGTPRKFLDALLASSRLELFKQGVEIVAAGDSVGELYIVVAGRVEMRSPLDATASLSADGTMYGSGGSGGSGSGSDGDFDGGMLLNNTSSLVGSSLTSINSDDDGSVDAAFSNSNNDIHDGLMSPADAAAAAEAAAAADTLRYVGAPRSLGVGEPFGETSFFTDIPQMATVRSLTTVRVMVVTRQTYESLERAYPVASRIVQENLRRRSEALVAAEFPGFAGTDEFADLLASSPASLLYSWASPELVELMAASGGVSTLSARGGLSARQELVISNLVRVNAVIAQSIAKQDEDRTTEFL